MKYNIQNFDNDLHKILDYSNLEMIKCLCLLHGEYITNKRNLFISDICGCKECRKERTKITKKEKYGDDWNNSQKGKLTRLEKYGSYFVNNEKAKLTKKEKYGDENYNNSEKMKQTCLQKYGKSSVLALNEIRNKKNIIIYNNLIKERLTQDHINQKIKEINDTLIYEVISTFIIDNIVNYEIKCKSCKNIFNWNEFIYTNQRTHHSPYCDKCTNHYSKEEKYVVEYIKSIYNGPILENDRNILFGKELDIYLPELKLAIEYNGIFWHGFHKYSKKSIKTYKDNIEEKRKWCNLQQIQLLSIDDCDWKDRPEVFKRFLQDRILPRQKIFARKCIIKFVSTIEAKQFCEYYHVNGFRGGSTKLGLYFNNELVCLAIFAKYKDNYECIRLCYKTGIDIIGGWAKIQKHFGKRFLHYINLKYFNGENKTGIGYRFVNKHNMQILHRNSLWKSTGLKKYCKNIDPKLSDFDNCINNDFIAVFDLGNDIRWYN